MSGYCEQALASALFSRLYAHDADWLKSVPVYRRPRAPRFNPEYWEKRDKALIPKVELLVDEIYQRLPMVRVTKSRIGRELGIINTLRQYLFNLPEVARAIERHVETVEDFQLRRLKLAFQNYSGMLSKSELIKVAGMRIDRTRPAVIEAIDSLISKGKTR